MIEKLARFSYRRRWTVLIFWVLFSFGLVSVAGMAQPDFSSDYSLAGSDSQRAYDVLATHFPDQSGGVGEVVFHADSRLDDPQTRAEVEAVVAELRAIDPTVVAVTSPFDPATPVPMAADGRTGVAVVQFSVPESEVPYQLGNEIRAFADDADSDRLQVELFGPMLTPVPSTGLSETVGLVAAVIILLVAFGSLLLVGMPLLTAIVGLFTTLGAIMLATKVMDVPDFTMSTAAMIVLGVGVDYALFLATRFAAELRGGASPEQAIVSTARTAGRAVTFAGVTVVISLGGMLAMGIPFVQGLAIGAALGVLLTMLVALTLVPALLAFAGRRILTWRIFRSRRSAAEPADATGSGWARWSGWTSRRALPLTLIATAVLLLLASPVLAMRLGSSDASNYDTGETTRRAYDLKAAAYGAGSTAPFQVVVDLNGADRAVADRLVERMRATDSVAQVSPPALSGDGQAALISVVPAAGAQDEGTVALLETLRERVIPDTVEGTPAAAHVGGVTASFHDLADKLASRLPLFVVTVLGLSLVLLILVFRALVAPLQAVLVTLLSLGVAYAVLVVVFQWGWGAGLIGVGKSGPLESYTPMTLMALLFGLSMDYQVFLLSRVREALRNTRDHRDALREGLRSSGRVIVAAALIMAAVFASFILSPDRIMKQFGLGLAVAVLIEAAIVVTLTPALLALLGWQAWRLPRWLSWLPDLRVEGPTPTDQAPAAKPAVPQSAAKG